MPRYAPAFPRLFSLLTAILTISSLQSPVTAQTPVAQPPGQAASIQQIKTLAIVNGQEITRQQIANECMRRFGSDTLESIINKFLVAQECQKAGIQITEKDVNDEIVAKAKNFGMSGERYIQTICGRKNISPDRFKNDFVWNELALRRLASQNIHVSAEELNERMEFEFGNKVQIRQIVCDSLQQANQLQQRAVANPEEFERLAKKFSVDLNSQSMGGLLPPIRKNSGLPEFEQLAFSLKPGEISRVLPVADKFVIMRCEREYPADQLSNEQLTMAHERLVEQISNEKLNQAASDLFEQLQQTTTIVNVLNDPKLRQQHPGVAAIVNNRQILINSVAEDCITRFGSEMLDTEINRTILIQALKQRGLQVQQEDLNAEIARVAEKAGYLNADGTVNIDQWLAYATGNNADRIDFYIEDEVWPTVALMQLVKDSVSVSAEDLQKGFEANFGPRVEVLAIMANDQRTARKVWDMASANLTVEYFGQLANQYSIEPLSKNNFGVVPPIQKHGGRPELENEAFKLQAGELSKVIQVGEQWIMLYCVGRTEPVVTDPDAVREDLHDDIFSKKLEIAMSNEFQKLRADAQVDNFLEGTSQPGAAAVQAARQAANSNLPFSGQRR